MYSKKEKLRCIPEVSENLEKIKRLCIKPHFQVDIIKAKRRKNQVCISNYGKRNDKKFPKML